MASANIHLIINRRSRQARAAQKNIEASLDACNLSAQQVHDVSTKDMATICRSIVKQNPKLVVICGGDGTVSSALHYFAKSGIEIGIVPLGTTNNFARSLNIPQNINEAVAVIKRAKPHPVDLGEVNGRYFANVVGIGLSSVIARNVKDSVKKRFGRLAYTLAGLRQLAKHRAFTVTLRDKDNELVYSFETHQVIVANGRYHAGKKIAQDVAVDNRELVVFALGGRGWLSFAWHTIDFYLGRRKKIVHSSYVVGRTIHLDTSRQQNVEIDGETGGTTPLTLKVEPKAVLIRHRL